MRLNISKVQLKDLFTQAQKPWQLEFSRENCVFPNQLLTGEIGHKKGCCSGHLSANALTSSRLLQLPVFCMKYTDLPGNDYYTLSCSEIWKCLKLETDDNNLQSCTLLLQKKRCFKRRNFYFKCEGSPFKICIALFTVSQTSRHLPCKLQDFSAKSKTSLWQILHSQQLPTSSSFISSSQNTNFSLVARWSLSDLKAYMKEVLAIDFIVTASNRSPTSWRTFFLANSGSPLGLGQDNSCTYLKGKTIRNKSTQRA